MRKKVLYKRLNMHGFTIVEMLVAIFVFTIVMVISTGAILSVLDANRKTQSVQLVVDNVDFAVESMTRTLRTGSSYHCDISAGTIINPRNCKNGADSIVFEEAKKDPNNPNDNYVYRLNTTTKQIERSTNSGSSFVPITASNVEITGLTFYVVDAEDPTDQTQPRIIISVRGKAGGADVRSSSVFNLQTTVSQRLRDI